MDTVKETQSQENGSMQILEPVVFDEMRPDCCEKGNALIQLAVRPDKQTDWRLIALRVDESKMVVSTSILFCPFCGTRMPQELHLMPLSSLTDDEPAAGSFVEVDGPEPASNVQTFAAGPGDIITETGVVDAPGRMVGADRNGNES